MSWLVSIQGILIGAMIIFALLLNSNKFLLWFVSIRLKDNEDEQEFCNDNLKKNKKIVFYNKRIKQLKEERACFVKELAETMKND